MFFAFFFWIFVGWGGVGDEDRSVVDTDFLICISMSAFIIERFGGWICGMGIVIIDTLGLNLGFG